MFCATSARRVSWSQPISRTALTMWILVWKLRRRCLRRTNLSIYQTFGWLRSSSQLQDLYISNSFASIPKGNQIFGLRWKYKKGFLFKFMNICSKSSPGKPTMTKNAESAMSCSKKYQSARPVKNRWSCHIKNVSLLVTAWSRMFG